jgi:hypothetical protein
MMLAGIEASAFSSEVDTGSREENASKQKSRAPFRFNRNGKGSGAAHSDPRTFKCPNCDHVEKRLIASDPLRLKSTGWLAGMLRALS